jgi:predicted DCC family thiol-disulfide oxidoreductase YuxK
MTQEKSHNIVAFDGVCNLCNSTVNWIIDNDPKQQFRFIALQDIARLEALGFDLKELQFTEQSSSVNSESQTDESQMQSVYLIEQGKLFDKSTAVLRICRQLSGLYPLLYLYILIPRPLRDLVYDFIAKNRYKWFGRRAQCRVPSAALSNRFL